MNEELNDLIRDEIDYRRSFEQDKLDLENAKLAVEFSEKKWLRAKLSLLEFKEKMNHD